MPPTHRKSAMRVRDGRVVKKNNWAPARHHYYARPQSEILIERADPGPGYKHVVTVRQLRDFIDLLPDWDELAVGLDAISIWSGHPSWLGLSNPGRLRPPRAGRDPAGVPGAVRHRLSAARVRR